MKTQDKIVADARRYLADAFAIQPGALLVATNTSVSFALRGNPQMTIRKISKTLQRTVAPYNLPYGGGSRFDWQIADGQHIRVDVRFGAPAQIEVYSSEVQ